MSYAALSTIQTIATGQPFLAATLQQANDSLEFLVDPPACAVENSSVISVADNTPTALTANSETFDNDSMHSTASNTSRITIQTAGRYLFFAAVSFTPDADGYRALRLRVDGTTVHDIQIFPAGGTAQWAALSGVKALVLSAGQYVETVVQHTAGAAIDVDFLEFSAVFITR